MVSAATRIDIWEMLWFALIGTVVFALVALPFVAYSFARRRDGASVGGNITQTSAAGTRYWDFRGGLPAVINRIRVLGSSKRVPEPEKKPKDGEQTAGPKNDQ